MTVDNVIVISVRSLREYLVLLHGAGCTSKLIICNKDLWSCPERGGYPDIAVTLLMPSVIEYDQSL